MNWVFSMSPSPKVISPGQGLLLLITHYKNDNEKVNRLKELYLSGAENKNDAKEIKRLLRDPVISEYNISNDIQIINNDPTRRYFETHLAYESLVNGLNKIDIESLESHFESLKNMLPQEILDVIEHVLKREFKESDIDYFKEYSDYIAKIQSGRMFENLLPEDREKIELMVKCSLLGVVNAWHVKLPLDIYGKGIYLDKNKGKVIVQDQKSTRNHNLGIMKGHMPIALDDIARSDQEIPYLKPSDKSSFVKNARWIRSNFDRLVHPFSNSISGTMLCQLRSHAKLRKDGNSVFTDSAEEFAQYIQLLISAMLYGSGGHTLHEFTAPISLGVVKTEFKSIKDFEKINLRSMYLTNNEEAFDKALQDAIDYNNRIFLRDNLHSQIINSKPVVPENKVLSKFKINQKLNHLSELVTSLKESYENQLWIKSSRINKLLQMGLERATKHMDNGNLAEAQNAIKELKQKFEEIFRKENWSKKSKSFRLIVLVERALAHIKNEFEYDTAKLQKRTVLGELVVPKLEGDLENEDEDELTVRARSRLKPVKDRLDEITSLDRKNKEINRAYIVYTNPRDERNETQEQYEQRIKEATDILLKSLNIKPNYINSDTDINQQIMRKMTERQEEYRQSLFTRGKGSLAERLDKAWECYNNIERTKEDREIAQSYLIFVLDIKEEDITDNLNVKLQNLMVKREIIREVNPEYIPGKSPIALDEEIKGKLTKTPEPGLSDYEVITKALQEETLLDVNAVSRKKDSGEATGQKTEFFDVEQRDMMRILIRKGKFVTPEGELFDTNTSISKFKKGFAAFTLNVNGEISVFQHRLQEVNGVAHSSMNSAMPVFCAGDVKIENGKLLTITDRSGHYAPSLYNIYNALNYFKKRGIDISETKVYTSVKPSNLMNIDVHISEEHPQFYELNAKDLCGSYSDHLSKLVNNIQNDLAAYRTPSFKKLLYKLKDFFLNSTLTKKRETIAKQLSEGLASLTKELNSSNTLDGLKEVNNKIGKLIDTAHKKNLQLNVIYGKDSSLLTRHTVFFREKSNEFTGRLDSAIQTKKEEGLELSEDENLSPLFTTKPRCIFR